MGVGQREESYFLSIRPASSTASKLSPAISDVSKPDCFFLTALDPAEGDPFELSLLYMLLLLLLSVALISREDGLAAAPIKSVLVVVFLRYFYFQIGAN